MLYITWRQSLCVKLHEMYFSNILYYHVNVVNTTVDNPYVYLTVYCCEVGINVSQIKVHQRIQAALIIIIIMKNFVTMAQSAMNWHNTHTHAFTHTRTSTQLHSTCEVPAQLLQNLESIFF